MSNTIPKVYFVSVCKDLYFRNGGSVLGRHLRGVLARQGTLQRFVKGKGKVSIMKI